VHYMHLYILEVLILGDIAELLTMQTTGIDLKIMIQYVFVFM
jgi:hypothetical protein